MSAWKCYRHALRRARQRADRGSETLAYVIVFPVLVLTIVAGLQTCLWFLGRATALSAAQEGVRAARAHNPSADAVAVARRFITDVGTGLLNAPSVQMRSNNASIEVTVSGQVPSLIPGLTFPVRQVARGARERFTLPSGRTDSSTPAGSGR
jgi:hypothetical protein